jgi:hypothetical protein
VITLTMLLVFFLRGRQVAIQDCRLKAEDWKLNRTKSALSDALSAFLCCLLEDQLKEPVHDHPGHNTQNSAKSGQERHDEHQNQ